MGGGARVGGFLKVIPTVGGDFERVEEDKRRRGAVRKGRAADS
jgi:hypothetical protein